MICQASTHAVTSTLSWLFEAGYVRFVRSQFDRQHGHPVRLAILTNGGLLELARRARMTPRALSSYLGWNFENALWRTQRPDEVADAWFALDRLPGRHRQEVLGLLGLAAQGTREQAFWGLKLEYALAEYEVAALMGWRRPRPDGYLF